ncbi:lipopolysaccharide biosynthesis protein [Capnocytophaga sp.]|uniref:lipopolysaccharide biosynthesis protein n=1 Tax=Capnocytophaga sp. TaxID=44737 RepID=UPI0026DC0A3C|nr:oligosaccharide flippase family protein [Capnocytophaga sp.]MDO5106246.1 oligosaccharide flippase family protein [Capnocytophaga sp.]
MGVVFRQSVKNILSTYLGFAFGAVNTLFLFVHFLSKEEYGLVSYVTSTATILSPLIAFGVHNTLIRFYSSYKEPEQLSKFNLMLFVMPLAIILPFSVIGFLAYEQIVKWLSGKNEIVAGYIPLLFLTATVMAYFEVFYSWARVQFKTVFGNFLKEVFHRVCTTFLLISIYLQWIDFNEFMWAILIVYTLRMLLMLVSAFLIKCPTFLWGMPRNKREIFKYSFFIILSGSVASLLMDIDKFMINQYLPISEIAIYNVAVFTATVIVIPYRSMYQIISPLVAKLLNNNETSQLRELYKKSTVNLYLISMLIFILIIINAHQFYKLLPDPSYSNGIFVLIFIALVKLSDALVGINNAILFNSVYYRIVLYLGVFLTFCTIGLNIWLIPIYGINGAGIATLCAFFSYNILKLSFVHNKFGLNPFYTETLKITLFGIVATLIFFFWDFSFHPILNICLKSTIFLIISIFIAHKFKLSEDIRQLLSKQK